MSRPTQDELQLARDIVLLEFLVGIVTNNREDIKLSNYTLKSLYVATTDAVLDSINSEIRKIKAALKQSDAKISKDNPTDTELRYVIHCRGYEEKFSILRHTLKPELGIILGRHVKKIEGLFRNF